MKQDSNTLTTAIKWWENTIIDTAKRVEWKTILCIKHFGYNQDYTRLTDEQILGIYNWEHPEQPSKEDDELRMAYQSADMQDYENKTGQYSEQSNNRGEGFTADEIYFECCNWFEKRQIVLSGINAGSYLDKEDFETNAKWIKDQFLNLKAENKTLKELERSFYMDICRAYNAGKENALAMVAEGLQMGERSDTFISSHDYFIGEFPTFKTNVP